MKIEINIDDCPEWWFKFVLSFGSEVEFENSLKKCGIVMEEIGSNVYNLSFDNEQDYVMFMMRWT